MNTPAHLIVNLCVLGRKKSPRSQWAILLGALLPDSPMFLFYFVEKVIRDVPEYLIWTRDYYLDGWQNFIDVFNSIPLIGLGWFIAFRMQSRVGQLLFLSMMVHVFGDLPVHHDDAHRHFFPLFNWRFESPISYWDPQHYGHIVTLFEIGALLLCSVFLLRGGSTLVTKWCVGIIGILYALFFGYALWVWN